MRVHLANDEDFIALTRSSLSHNFLSASVSIGFCRVDERHIEVDAGSQCGHFCFVRFAVLTHPACALSEQRYRLSRGQ
ncbi:hypothetical protein RHODGE_RHODGE_01349 [Rhodoplanes serenus]|uniref:Uncharacterized protein n=1 Tax=Rhodoplanes serenus TaxID=200615 RepID=A0A3S4CDY8_9BRAD|nr:hypothetical protein RHODGE_RHODGE_01349 [Rhodoplanes serenus]